MKTTTTEPVLSILFGTFNRLALLQQCVSSVRGSVADLPYEIVVCDGGSTDGSRDWLASQPDIAMIGARSLEGAVVAFNQCYMLSRGRYLATLNDDAEVVGDALARAVARLEADADVGQIALGRQLLPHVLDAKGRPFATGQDKRVHVNLIHPPDRYYANFGVIRRDLVDDVAQICGGMWNPIYHTYGGDSELSCWVWRLGYEVMAAPDLIVRDLELRDGLREHNHERDEGERHGRAELDGKHFWNRWSDPKCLTPAGPLPHLSKRETEALRARERVPRPKTAPPSNPHVAVPPDSDAPAPAPSDPAPPSPASSPTVPAAPLPPPASAPSLRPALPSLLLPPEGDARPPLRAERLPDSERVLHLHLRTPQEPQDAMAKAIAALGRAGARRIDWVDVWAHRGPQELRAAVNEAADAIRPTLVFMQLQRGDVLSPAFIKQLRERCDERAVFVHWTGDVTGQFGDASHWSSELAGAVDLMLFSCMTHVRANHADGRTNAGYLQIGYDDDRYFPGPDRQYGRQFDVCFLATRYDTTKMRPSVQSENDAELRTECGEFLMRRFGKRSGVFGGGWPRGPIDPRQSADIYRSSHLALSVSYSSFLERYSSDRLLRALGCGTPTLCKRFVGHESWGLRDHHNVLLFDTAKECADLAQLWTSHAKRGELRSLGRRGAELAKTAHTWERRMHELWPMVAAVRGDPVLLAGGDD